MDKHRIHLGLYRQMDLDVTDEALELATDSLNRHTTPIQAFFKEQFGHIWDVQCRAYAFRGEGYVYPPTFATAERKAFLESREDQTYQPTHHMLNNGQRDNMCGQAGVGDLSGGKGNAYTSSGCGLGTMCHEFGHTIGYHHSSEREPGDDHVDEYGDSTSIMGNSPAGQLVGFNSPQRVMYEADPEETILRPTETQQVLLTPIEMHPKSMRDGEYKHIVFKIDNNMDIHISTRKRKGYLYYGGGPTTLYVHERKVRSFSGRPLRKNYTILIDHVHKNNPVVVLENGVKIEFLESADETIRLNIYMNENDPAPADIPMPTGFPAFIPTVELNESHSGAWANLNYNGQGFDLHVKNGRMVLFWYTYNMENPYRRFYFGNVDLKPGIEEFDLFTTEDGTWQDPTKHKEVAAGKGQIYFYDDGHGVFNYNTPEHGRGSIELTPIVKTQGNPLDGAWGQPSRNGEGMTLRFTDNICSGMWYSYGPPPLPFNPYSGNLRQRWYVFLGEKDPDGVYRLNIYETQKYDNRCFYMRDEIEETKVGTAKLTVVDGKLVWEYDMFGTDRANGTGTHTLEKIF